TMHITTQTHAALNLADETRARAEQPQTDGARGHDDTETLLTYRAAALYVATAAYNEARTMPNPDKTLDDMCDAVPEMMPAVCKVVSAAPEFAEIMRDVIADYLWAFTVIEHARAEVGQNFGYVFDVMADYLKGGADPQSVRDEVSRVSARLRIENAVAAASDAIRAAVTMALAGLTTQPRDVARQLHEAIDDAQAEHLALPTVGGMSLEEAESSEAVSTAWEAMARALASSADRDLTVGALRGALRMAVEEACA
ncbi:hypothetical protein O3Q52_53240, partial [Streptomyces sp. ActVer]|uniref:hypothetical protein n=1 Tax=Streptomyces sp. ActVer TaxID=3014558 RepID=UPI0022B56F84